MMYNFPVFPHFYPRYSYNYPQNNARNVNNAHSVKKQDAYNDTNRNTNTNYHHNEKTINEKRNHNNNIIYNQENNMNNKKEKDDTIFEIFGIKLHYDDILLICLIFFLYTEGVKDEFLFIALVLLLLS